MQFNNHPKLSRLSSLSMQGRPNFLTREQIKPNTLKSDSNNLKTDIEYLRIRTGRKNNKMGQTLARENRLGQLHFFSRH